MEKFLLLIREDLQFRANLTPAEFRHNLQIMTKWVEGMAQSGNFLNADPLTNKGAYIGQNYVLSDGPFIEAKESISGFILIQAESLDQAVSFAQLCPLVLNGTAAVEVRHIMHMDDVNE
jgi:hypothetical protein